MNIYEYVDGLLAQLGVPYYHGTPETPQLPERCVSYTVYYRDRLLADDAPVEGEADVYLTIYTTGQVDTALIHAVKGLFADHALKGGGDVPALDGYPYQKAYYLDYAVEASPEEN